MKFVTISNDLAERLLGYIEPSEWDGPQVKAAREELKAAIAAETHQAAIRISYSGDYPGVPYAYLNEKPVMVTKQEEFLSMIAGLPAKSGLSRLLDKLGVPRSGDEHAPFHGLITITPTAPPPTTPEPS